MSRLFGNTWYTFHSLPLTEDHYSGNDSEQLTSNFVWISISIENIFKYQTQYDISNKIELITIYKEKIKLNSNLNLLMDKLIIELEGGI